MQSGLKRMLSLNRISDKTIQGSIVVDSIGYIPINNFTTVEEQKVELKGLNLDTVWENIAIAVSGVNIEKGNTLDEQIEINAKK